MEIQSNQPEPSSGFLPPDELSEALAGPGAADLRRVALEEALREKIGGARRVLLVGVGGGNDSVSALMVRAQLEKDFGLAPDAVAIAAMLPDVLEYRNLGSTPCEHVVHIESDSERWLGGRKLTAFPEPLLARDKHLFNLEAVYGLRMDAGSEGVREGLAELVAFGQFDLVLACDVGGDFIAAPENCGVLSPMMDGYALHAFRSLGLTAEAPNVIYCVFGLGTDGESTPEMLRLALDRVPDHHAGMLEGDRIRHVEDFYRNVVAPNRHSRTADFTLRLINGEELQTVTFKARFHTTPLPGSVKTYYGEFQHTFAPEFAGRYYLFEDINNVQNPFEVRCTNGLQWFLKIHGEGVRYNHELAGQSYPSVERFLDTGGSQQTHSILFATPSDRFSADQKREILADTVSALENGIHDFAIVFNEDLSGSLPATLATTSLSPHLTVLYLAGNPEKASLAQALSSLP